jgi:hypothetical protein
MSDGGRSMNDGDRRMSGAGESMSGGDMNSAIPVDYEIG